MTLLFITPHTISLHRRIHLRLFSGGVRVKTVTRRQDWVRLLNPNNHHALNFEFFTCHRK